MEYIVAECNNLLGLVKPNLRTSGHPAVDKPYNALYFASLEVLGVIHSNNRLKACNADPTPLAAIHS